MRDDHHLTWKNWDGDAGGRSRKVQDHGEREVLTPTLTKRLEIVTEKWGYGFETVFFL